MKTIIAAVDFSPASINAAHYAADLAVKINAELLLMNVIPVPFSVVGEIPGSGYLFDKMIGGSEEELTLIADELLVSVKNKINIRTRTPVGSVSYSLREAATEEKAICIVMGADSTATIEHLLTENQALAAIHSVRIPILIIPQGTSFKNITQVLMASDLRGYENLTALQILKEWLSMFRVKLDVVNVVEKSQLLPNKVTGFRTLQSELSACYPRFHFIYEDEVRQGIDSFIEQNHPDLLVTMPGKRGFFNRLFHKSESKQLIRHPHIPILSIYK